MKNLKSLFIPYELAKIAKEKGFDEPCIAYHRELLGSKEPIIHFDEKNSPFTNSGLGENIYNMVAAPLYQQIMDWFRVEHKIIIAQEIADTYSPVEFRVYKNNSSRWFKYVNIEEQYYSVFNQAIEEAFKLI